MLSNCVLDADIPGQTALPGLESAEDKRGHNADYKDF